MFLASAGVLVLYALRGGSFDVVARSELGIAAWWAVAIGWALGVLPRARLGLGAALPVAGLALLAAWTALSLTWTESDERTVTELARVAHHAGFLVLALSVLSRRTWRAAAAGAAAGALAVCALAVASRLWPAAFPADAVRASFGGSRLNYPLNYWNAVGAWGSDLGDGRRDVERARAQAGGAHARPGRGSRRARGDVPDVLAGGHRRRRARRRGRLGGGAPPRGAGRPSRGRRRGRRGGDRGDPQPPGDRPG